MQTRLAVQLCMWPCVQNPICAYYTDLFMADPTPRLKVSIQPEN